jgi:type IV pilus assembly protein PilA
MKNIHHGFAMVNKMIMLAFIAILAAVAIPAYGEFTSHVKDAQAPTQLNGPNLPLTELYMTTGLL